MKFREIGTTSVRIIAALFLLNAISSCREKSQAEGTRATASSQRRLTDPDRSSRSLGGGTDNTIKAPSPVNPNANTQRRQNLAELSSEELKELLLAQSNGATKRVDSTTLAIFAKHAGAAKNPVDFEFILSLRTDTGQLQSILEEYFRAATNGAPDHNIDLMIESINPGTNRSKAVSGYFKTLNVSVEQALGLLDGYSFPEDRIDALNGLAMSKTWLPVELTALAKEENDQSLIKKFFSTGITESLLRKKTNWAEESWNNLSEVTDTSQKRILAETLFSEIGLRQPEMAINLLSQLPEDERLEILNGTKSDQVIVSWSSKSPEASLQYLFDTPLVPSNMERLVSKGLNQWIMSDSIAASQWIAGNLDKPYMQTPVKNLIHFLEQRGENADSWKKALADMQSNK